MQRTLVVLGMSLALAAGGLLESSTAQTTCPEVDSAKQAYADKLNELKLKDKDIRPRTLAGVRTQEAPRSAEEAPRQSVQQAPRSDPKAARQNVERAKALIADADKACRAGKSTDAATKASEALELLK